MSVGSVLPFGDDGWTMHHRVGYMPNMNGIGQKDDPSIPIGAYWRMMLRWKPIRACLEGNQYLRSIAHEFIPQLPNEADECYSRRLDCALFSPYTQRIIDAAIGLVLRRPIKLEGGSEAYFEEWARDVDRQGTDLDEFARNILRTTIGYGHAGIMVDYPKAEGIRTLKDELQAQLKPYFTAVDPYRILGWRHSVLDNGGRLTQVRIREVATRPEGEFGETVVERIRVLEPGSYRLFERENGEASQDWIEIEKGSTSVSEVPLFICYSQKEAAMVSRPPLLEVAAINLAHYKLQSQHLHALQVAGFPLLVLRGYDDQGSSLNLDVSKALALPVEGGAEYVEPANQAFAAYQEELEKLADQMSNLGISVLAQQKRVAESGLSKQLDKADSHSLLATISMDLEQTLQHAINMAAEYAGQEPPVVGLSRDFDVEKLDGGSVTAINTLFNSGLIDQGTALELLRRGEWLGDEVDVEEIMAAAELEQQQSMEEQITLMQAKPAPVAEKKAPPEG